MKHYTVKQYTTPEYEAYTEENDLPEYDVINIARPEESTLTA